MPGPGITITSPPGVPEGRGRVTVALAEGQNYAGDFGDTAFHNAKQELIGMFPYIRLLGWDSLSQQNVPSGFVTKFQVPHTLEGAFQIMVYATVFGEDDIVAGSGVQHAGVEFTYSMLRDYQPEDDTYGTLVDNLITPQAPLSVEIPFGDEDGIDYDGDVMVYKAFDPMVIHNNPNDTLDDPARIVRALGELFPQVPANKGNATEVALANVTAQAGSMVAIQFMRTGVSNPNTEYKGRIGFMKLRWRLARVEL